MIDYQSSFKSPSRLECSFEIYIKIVPCCKVKVACFAGGKRDCNLILKCNNLKLPLLLCYSGSKKSEKAPESQPAVAPWSGSSLSGSRRRGADKPKPLWRPVCEEEEDMLGSSSDESKPSVSKPSISTQEETSPPSPRTLTAIQAAMNDSSDEEKVDQKEKDGGVSPRTLLAIQKALEEEEEHAAERRTLIISSPTKPQVDICHPVQQVVISSSEEETEPDVLPNANSLSNIKSYFKENPIDQSLHVKDNLLVSSSEDEMEEVIGERNKALHSVVSHQPHGGSDGPKELERQKEVQMTSEEEARKEKLIEKLDKPFKKTETHPLIPAQRGNTSIVLQEQRADDVKSESREESESEGNSSLRSDFLIISLTRRC